jgi:hypothetical protein
MWWSTNSLLWQNFKCNTTIKKKLEQHIYKFLYLLKKKTIFFFEIENLFIMEIFLQIQGDINCNIHQHKVKVVEKVTWICTSTSLPLSLISTQYIITGMTNKQWQRSKQCAANIFHYYSTWMLYQFLMCTKILSRCFNKRKLHYMFCITTIFSLSHCA